MQKNLLASLILVSLSFSNVYANSYKAVNKLGSNYLDLSSLVANGLSIAVKNAKTGQITYSHDGLFIKRDGYYYQNNLRLQGYPIPTQLTADACTLGDIKAAASELKPQATSSYELILNLDSDSQVIATTFSPVDDSSYNYEVIGIAFDKSGKRHDMVSYFVKTYYYNYDLHVWVDGNEVALGHLKFNVAGDLSSSDLDEIQFLANNEIQKISYSLKGSTQIAGTTAVLKATTDGHGHADFIEEVVDPNGNLYGSFTGFMQPLGKIGLYY